jgi:hypothetical protein
MYPYLPSSPFKPAVSSPLAKTVINASPVEKKLKTEPFTSPVEKKLKTEPFTPERVFSSREVDGILKSVEATPEKIAERKKSFEFDDIKIPKLKFEEFEEFADKLPVSVKEEVVESKVKSDVKPSDSQDVFKRESEEKLAKREKKERKREKKEKKRVKEEKLDVKEEKLDVKEEKLEEKEEKRLLPVIKEESAKQTVQSRAFSLDKPSSPNRKQRRQKLAQAIPIKHPMGSKHTTPWSSPSAQLHAESNKSSSPASRKKKDKKHKGKHD